MSSGKKMEEKRDNLRKCLFSIQGKIIGCKSYEEEYKKARNQFLEPLKKIEDTPIDRPSKRFNQDDADQRMLLAHGASGLRETLQGRRQHVSLIPFEETTKSLEEYCKTILDILLNNEGGPSSAVSDSKGFTTEHMSLEKLNKAKQTLLEMIKQ